jgi:hypothetical protein
MTSSTVVARLRGVSAALCVVLAACGEMAAVKGLLAVSAAVSQKYGEAPGVDLNGGHLTVMFQNSHYKDLPAPQRDAFALAVAKLAVASYPLRDSLEGVSVGFKTVTGGVGVTITKSDVPYEWKVTELAITPDSAAPAPVKP